jgi:NADPH2:quinone reductase
VVRAAVCREYGPPESVRVEDDWPSAGLADDQVRVRITAAAVNFPDVLLVANQYQVTVPVPFVPGSEFAGVVTEAGPSVSGTAAGDRVFGSTAAGAFAEEITVSSRSLTHVPDGVEDAHAAAFGVAHRTSYHVLRSVADVQPGERVVVLGAGGGVGLAAVQLAKLLGADVTAVASSPEKLAAAKEFGATTLIDHKEGKLRQALKDAFPDGVDVVVDPVGGDLAEPALRALRYKGRFVTVGYAGGSVPKIPLNLVLLKGCQILGFEMRTFSSREPDKSARDEKELIELLAAGKAFPRTGATFTLADAAAALRHVADGQAIGKVVLEIS